MKFFVVLYHFFVLFGLRLQPRSPTLIQHDAPSLRAFRPAVLFAKNNNTISPTIVRHQKTAGNGYVSGSPLYHKQQAIQNGTYVKGEPKPKPIKDKELPISTTVKCILNLTVQFFIIYTALAVVRTMNKLRGDSTSKLQRVCEATTKSVDYAPMLCALFLGTRMRAIQLAQGDTEHYELPQPWVQNAMQLASFAVLIQALIVVVGSFLGDVSVDDEERSPPSGSAAVAMLEIGKYVTMLALYGGFITVVVGAVWMPVPKKVWGDKDPPVSPAVSNTINLGAQYFIVYLILAIFRTKNQLNKIATTKEQEVFTLAADTVKIAPMLCIMFLAVRQRALAMDPKNGNPQGWAQNCMYLCSYSVLVQTLIVIAVPTLFGGECKKGMVEGDVQFEMQNTKMYTAFSFLRWLLMLALYSGFTAVAVSPFVLKKADGSPAPPISPALGNVLNLVSQFFFVYLFLWIALTYWQFYGGGLLAVEVFSAAKATVMFCPMLSVLFVAARMRAQQIGQIMNFEGSPQGYAQDAMHLSTWSLLVQLIMVLLVGIASGKIETDADGNVKSTGSSIWHKLIELVRYLCLLCLYGGVIVILYAIFTVDADTANPINKTQLIPGVRIPAASDVSQSATTL